MAYDLDYYPSMAIRVAQTFLGVVWSKVGVELGRGISMGPVHVPTDPAMRLMVNYLGPAQTFPTFPLSQVLSGNVDPAVFANRIVLVGANALGTGDTFASPFTSVMPGVERLATVVDSIIHQRYLSRPASALWAEVGAMLASALVLGFAMSRLSLAAATVCAVALIATIAIAGQVALTTYGIWQTSVVPALAIVLTFTALLFYRYALLDKERRHIRRAFQRYLAPNMVDRLVSEERLPELGGELRELTILFCDLRGFTALSESLAPSMLTRLANEFFAAATEAVLEHGGTVDKYLGDAIMALWNAPIAVTNHAELACRAALRILEKVDALNASLARETGVPLLAVGIGINTGPCTVGNFGSARRFDYSAIGDAVNVAARLESETKASGAAILIGPETAARIGGFAVLPLERVALRGRTASLYVFALVGDETVAHTPAFALLRARHARLRDAVLAGDWDAARQLVADLRSEAPAALQPMYSTYEQRLAALAQ
jgi:adenylate cyclase